MVCIYCGSPTEVKNSRLQRQNNHIWRRRKCTTCAAIFTTKEQPTLSDAFMVSKSAGLERFSRDQLFLAIYESCRHRPSAIADATALTQTIINKLAPTQDQAVIQRDTIVHQTHLALSRFDPVAATVYAAYHSV